jgi:type VI secretion system protein ImpC
MMMSDRETSVLGEIEAALGRPIEARERACLARGMRAFLASGLPPEAAVDAIVASLDRDLGRQVDEILHHPSFQALESAWRGLWLVASRVDRDQNVRCEVLNCSQEDLLADFEDSPEVVKSGLYKIVYSAEYGPFGGRPFAAILANYELGPFSPQNDALLRKCCEVGARAALPFLAAAAPSLAGPEPNARWRAFRESPVARFAGLVFPRCLGRAAHQIEAPFRYTETIQRPTDRLWQSGVFPLGVCIVQSFMLCRLASNITGPAGGVVEDLPTWGGPHGSGSAWGSVELPLSEQAESELAARGFIPLAAEIGSARAQFRLAPTCLAPTAKLPADLQPPDRELYCQLPALFLVTRIVHYLKVAHREQIGAWKGLPELKLGIEELLGTWTYQGGPEADGAAGGPLHLRTTRPLHRFAIRIDEVDRNTYRWPFEIRIEPNWSHDGRFFTLAAEGGLDCE